MTALVDRLEQLAGKATDAPWESDPAYPQNIGQPGPNPGGEWESLVAACEDEHDAALIVELRNALPALLTALRAARELSEAEWPPHILTRLELETALVPLFGEDTTP